MKWLDKVLAYLRPSPQVAKPSELPRESVVLQKQAREVLHDLRELRRLEIIVRKR